MPFSHYALAYAFTAVVFLVLDAIWLTLMADRLYRPAIGHLMADGFALAPALIFYTLYIGGVVLFAVAPALQERRGALHALLLGAALGLLAYGTYDLTNQATLKGWPWHVTVIDLIWGASVTGTSAAAAARITPWLLDWWARR